MKNYTSSISRHDWSLHRKGAIDQERHKQKIREAIKKNLADIVSEESIILSDGKKIVKVPIRSLEEYRFRYDPGRQQHSGQGDGKSKVGDVVGAEPQRGRGQARRGGRRAWRRLLRSRGDGRRTGRADLRGSGAALPRREEAGGDGNRVRPLHRRAQGGAAGQSRQAPHHHGEHQAQRGEGRSASSTT